MKNKTILVTGAAGFVGYYLSEKLTSEGHEGHKVIGIDNMNDYYDVRLKEERLNKMKDNALLTFVKLDLTDKEVLENLFKEYKPEIVVNLAAQAGVRYSIENPDAYIQSNIIGFHNILEACRHHPVEHLLYASSSSVYGSNKKVPFEETDFVDNPVSLYAATKKSNELMAHTYSHLYKIPATGLRFLLFTDQWEDQMWLTLDSQINSLTTSRSISLTMVILITTCIVTSRTLMIS